MNKEAFLNVTNKTLNTFDDCVYNLELGQIKEAREKIYSLDYYWRTEIELLLPKIKRSEKTRQKLLNEYTQFVKNCGKEVSTWFLYDSDKKLIKKVLEWKTDMRKMFMSW